MRHIEYCYINPVKDGLVTRVRDWPFSSFHRDVRPACFRKTGRASSRRSANSARREWRNKAIAPYDMLPAVEVGAGLKPAPTRKEDMRRRGVPSPDEWDAVALTFAEPVAPAAFRRRSRIRCWGSREGAVRGAARD